MPGSPSNSRLGRVVGLAFAAIAVLLVAVDRMTAIDVRSGFEDPGPITFGLGILAVVVVVILWFVSDSAFAE